jgi:hypothetical protein
MAFKLPKKGFVFWPVATGDSSTIVVKENEIIMQIDLHNCASADEKNSDTTPIVDELVRLLPKRNKKPYLAVFALTHPDNDHILGFGDLLSQVTIGELWHTPRIFREYKTDLTDDATKFREEADRRRKLMIKNGNAVESGDRLRVIGHDEGIFQDEKYRDFPKEARSYPGKSIEFLDGEDYVGTFEAFVHAPFKPKEDDDETRNNSSLALQVTLTEGSGVGKALFFGDREYPTIKQIFDITKERERDQYLEWNVQLAAHHCSKKVMFWKDDGAEGETSRKDIMDDFEAAALKGAYVVASCRSDFTAGKGDNPPHSKAREKYEGIVDAGNFLCTHEYPNKDKPEPIVFTIGSDGFDFGDERPKGKGAPGFAAAVATARGQDKPPSSQVGFGPP